ncbi:hypothetical protein JGU71_06770 [Antrihabitans sp. YC3-6]|uniref:WXG100 family type VII secretion target n=1 Tax=Antrihabitans stalagmiti TaxID=2799499 RepID=A0A934U208_9NOCA|nr:hypothetical protein [Antrihabitans stalagmiti]MBJ8338581.1 hypothetical protein [Antrihabitans stalagmiti]
MEFSYNKASIEALVADLAGFRTTLTSQADEVGAAAKGKIASGFDTPEGLTAFLQVQQKWDTEFSDTLVILNKLTTAAGDALTNVLGADQNVRKAFGV